jgi:hypothetical protein
LRGQECPSLSTAIMNDSGAEASVDHGPVEDSDAQEREPQQEIPCGPQNPEIRETALFEVE